MTLKFTKYIAGHFATSRLKMSPVDEPTISGFTPSELLAQYKDRTNGEKLYGEDWAPLGYDVIWAAALTINDTLNKLNEMSRFT